MKVELIKEEKDKKEINYPFLMQYKDEGNEFIVFFISDSEGVVVGDCKDYNNGHYCDYWCMSEFIPYEGKVILENDQTMPNNKIIVILGKCCAGKDTLARFMADNLGFKFIVSTTSRPMREGESEGNPYHFISDEEFQRKIANGDFIEYREYKRDNGSWHYGVEKTAIADNECYVSVLDMVGLREFKKQFGDRVFSIFLLVDYDERLRRCVSRGDFNEEEWKLRVISDEMFDNVPCSEFDYVKI